MTRTSGPDAGASAPPRPRRAAGRLAAIVLLLLALVRPADSQVLISLLFGDELNTGNIEFGLDGGVNWNTLGGVDGGGSLPAWNLGFYFDIRIADSSWMLHTGVIVKSTMGAECVPLYPLGDAGLDSSFAGGSVTKRFNYFDVPVMLKHRFANNVYVEGGMMAGLLYGATDEFVNSVSEEDDLSYERDVRDAYHPLDAGIVVGAGYRLMGGDGLNLGVRYYYGLVDVRVDDAGPAELNRSLYLTLGIPIGAGGD